MKTKEKRAKRRQRNLQAKSLREDRRWLPRKGKKLKDVIEKEEKIYETKLKKEGHYDA